jgi:hypothetical protein
VVCSLWLGEERNGEWRIENGEIILNFQFSIFNFQFSIFYDMRHQLSLEVPGVVNEKVFQVTDSSVYTLALPVECARLEITVPGFVSAAVVEVEQGFNLFLTSCDLGLQTVGCEDETQLLPDGIYVIRYSVSPNDAVFVEYNVLRLTQAWNRYFKGLCGLNLGGCEPDADVKERLRQFQLVRSFLEAAKAKVEYCHEPHKGVELMAYALRLMEKKCCVVRG